MCTALANAEAARAETPPHELPPLQPNRATLQHLWLEHASLGTGSGAALASALWRDFGGLQHLWLAGNALQTIDALADQELPEPLQRFLAIEVPVDQTGRRA